MAGSEQGLNKVRSILGKMDRSISDARKRRLGEPEGSPNANGVHEEDDLMIGHSEASKPIAREEPAKAEQVSEMRARYGKAKPIGPPNSNGPADANAQGASNGATPPHHDGDNPLNFHARPA